MSSQISRIVRTLGVLGLLAMGSPAFAGVGSAVHESKILRAQVDQLKVVLRSRTTTPHPEPLCQLESAADRLCEALACPHNPEPILCALREAGAAADGLAQLIQADCRLRSNYTVRAALDRVCRQLARTQVAVEYLLAASTSAGHSQPLPQHFPLPNTLGNSTHAPPPWLVPAIPGQPSLYGSYGSGGVSSAAQLLAEQRRLADQQRILEQQREQDRLLARQFEQQIAQQRAAEQRNLDQQRRIAEQNRIAEQRRLDEQRRAAERQRVVEQQRINQERAQLERLLAEQRARTNLNNQNLRSPFGAAPAGLSGRPMPFPPSGAPDGRIARSILSMLLSEAVR
ncbi:MAG: hypothetical protein ACE361_03290 [Aureliella sp.]